MAKKNKFLVFDVETAGSLGQPLIYDLAWRIIDAKGNVYQEENFLIREIFTNRDLMCDAYFADKYFTIYPDLIADGLQIKCWNEVLNLLKKQLDEEEVTVLSAYNSAFDILATLCTANHVHENGDTYNCINFENYKILDIYLMHTTYVLNSRKFQDKALQHLWITENGNFRTAAEIAWRYVSQIHDFIEAHTSLEDVEIETQMLLSCLKRKKKKPYNVLMPACIVSREAQPGKRYFHERVGITWRKFIDGQLSELGLNLESFREISRSEKLWNYITDYEVPKNPTVDQKKALLTIFHQKTGLTWHEWKTVPTTIQASIILRINEIPWTDLSVQEDADSNLQPWQLKKLEEELSILKDWSPTPVSEIMENPEIYLTSKG